MTGIMQESSPYVRFEYRPLEDRNASIEAGMTIYKNICYALITPVGGKDEMIKEAEPWLRQITDQSHQGRYNPEWVRKFKEMHRLFIEGEEIPEDGTPIKVCIMFTPAEQMQILGANVRTLEDLATCNEEALSRMGPGGRMYRDRAFKAITELKDPGKLAAKQQQLEIENEELKRQLAELRDLVGEQKPRKKAVGE